MPVYSQLQWPLKLSMCFPLEDTLLSISHAVFVYRGAVPSKGRNFLKDGAAGKQNKSAPTKGEERGMKNGPDGVSWPWVGACWAGWTLVAPFSVGSREIPCGVTFTKHMHTPLSSSASLILIFSLEHLF